MNSVIFVDNNTSCCLISFSTRPSQKNPLHKQEKSGMHEQCNLHQQRSTVKTHIETKSQIFIHLQIVLVTLHPI